MSPPRLRMSLSLLLLGGCLLSAAGRGKGAAGSATKSAGVPSGGSSGRFISPEHQACSWKLQLSTPGLPVGSQLSLRCQGRDGERHQCAYRGEPERCAAYAARRSHYWKQVLGGLRKKRWPCRDPAPLKARLCAGKRGRGAELRLLPQAFPPAGPTAAGLPRDFKPRARSWGQPREPATSPAGSVPPPPSPGSNGKHSEKTKRGKKKKAASDPDEERFLGTGPDPDQLDENQKLSKTYCAEEWHSLCNFLVSLWNG